MTVLKTIGIGKRQSRSNLDGNLSKKNTKKATNTQQMLKFKRQFAFLFCRQITSLKTSQGLGKQRSVFISKRVCKSYMSYILYFIFYILICVLFCDSQQPGFSSNLEKHVLTSRAAERGGAGGANCPGPPTGEGPPKQLFIFF